MKNVLKTLPVFADICTRFIERIQRNYKMPMHHRGSCAIFSHSG